MRHILACGASLWSVVTPKSSLGAAQNSLTWRGEGALYIHCVQCTIHWIAKLKLYNVTYLSMPWTANLC